MVYALPKRAGISYCVIPLPVFVFKKIAHCFNGSNTVLSRGCILCDVGGMGSITTPCSLQRFHASSVMCDWWSSRMRGTCFCTVGPTVLIKWRRHLQNNSPLIQPESDTPHVDPGGAPFIKDMFIFFRGKMNIGGIYDPDAPMAACYCYSLSTLGTCKSAYLFLTF